MPKSKQNSLAQPAYMYAKLLVSTILTTYLIAFIIFGAVVGLFFYNGIQVPDFWKAPLAVVIYVLILIVVQILAWNVFKARLK